MRVIEETAIADAALPLAVLKDFLRLGTGFEADTLQDAMLKAFLRAAIATIETRTGQILLQRRFRLEIDAWRDGLSEPIPLDPPQEILSVQIGTSTPEGLYFVTQAGRVRLVGRGGLPSLSEGPLILRLNAGIAAQWSGLPADLAQAVLMLAAHYYEYRAETGLDGGCLPFGVSALIEGHRPLRMGALA